jgi:hypothetical protein
MLSPHFHQVIKTVLALSPLPGQHLSLVIQVLCLARLREEQALFKLGYCAMLKITCLHVFWFNPESGCPFNPQVLRGSNHYFPDLWRLCFGQS